MNTMPVFFIEDRHSFLTMKKFILYISFCLLSVGAFAQFDNKITAQFSIGGSGLTGPTEIVDYYEGGFSIDGGLQYNFNRNFGLVAMAKYVTFFQSSLYGPDVTSYIDNFGVSICPKYKFRAGKKLQPYVLGGANFSFVSVFISDKSDPADPYTYYEEIPIALGYTAALGVEYGLSNNVSLFTQMGTNGIFIDDGAASYVNLSSIFFQFGLNLNLFKSKSL
jgi:opacity protein-like surface antigen